MGFKFSRELALIADNNGYALLCFQENIGMVSYKKEGVRINIWLTKGTVSTCIEHPTKGKTQLFRRGLSIAQVREVFKNPRTHTGVGYYKTQKTYK